MRSAITPIDLKLDHKPHPYRKWEKPEIIITKSHARAIISGSSNLYRSSGYLASHELSYRSFASIFNRLQKDVRYLKRSQIQLLITDEPPEEVMKVLRKSK